MVMARLSKHVIVISVVCFIIEASYQVDTQEYCTKSDTDESIECEGEFCTREFIFADINEIRGDIENHVRKVMSKLSTARNEEGCPQTKLTFPRDYKFEDYVLYNGSTVPQLVNVSICAWLTPPTGRDMGRGTVLSYYKYDSNDAGGNTMLISFQSNNRLYIATHNSWSTYFRLDKPVRDRTHFCFLFPTADGKAEIFRNGISLGQIINTFSNVAIPAGGALVIGNDQDRASDPNAFLGSMTHPADTFTGTIENLYIWSRILSEDEISELHNDPCACPRDHIIALTDANVETHGQTQVSSLRNDCD